MMNYMLSRDKQASEAHIGLIFFFLQNNVLQSLRKILLFNLKCIPAAKGESKPFWEDS